MKLRVVESYISVSGEAPSAGKVVLIIRFAGCNLDCTYCDTPYHSDAFTEYDYESLKVYISQNIKDYPGISVLFTGGEPLLDDKESIIQRIASLFVKIDFYVETNGSFPIKQHETENVFYVVDWKTPSSGMAGSFYEDNLRVLSAGDMIKFVCTEDDFPFILEKYNIIKGMNEEVKIALSGQFGKVDNKRIVDFIITNRLDARISLQLHKIIWPFEKRGV